MIKDVPTKAGVADLETRAAAVLRVRDIEEALSDNAVARKVRNETVAGILVLASIALFIFILFFLF
jgi:hypothetical protein